MQVAEGTGPSGRDQPTCSVHHVALEDGAQQRPVRSQEGPPGGVQDVGEVLGDSSTGEHLPESRLDGRLLLQGRRDWPGSELADRLEVSGRTVRRDVERLRSLGYPVESMTGPAGGYQLRAGAAMPPLLLDDDEAIAIAVGLRTAAGGSVTGIEETAVRALVKLEQVLPSHLRRRVQALTSATQTLQVYGGPQVDPQCLTVLATACRDHERARFAYTARDRAGTRREVEPHALVNAGRRWYLVAYDCGRSDWRTFRVDRIEKPASTGVRFQYTARDRAGSRRETEPHSLVNAGRRWYLVAWDCGRTDWRTFRVDRIARAESSGVMSPPSQRRPSSAEAGHSTVTRAS